MSASRASNSTGQCPVRVVGRCWLIEVTRREPAGRGRQPYGRHPRAARPGHFESSAKGRFRSSNLASPAPAATSRPSPEHSHAEVGPQLHTPCLGLRHGAQLKTDQGPNSWISVASRMSVVAQDARWCAASDGASLAGVDNDLPPVAKPVATPFTEAEAGVDFSATLVVRWSMRAHMPQRKAAVCTGASHSASMSASTAVTVIEQPAISSDVT
jgi:hypothetical protein